MGSGRWSPKDWDSYSTTNVKSKATVDAIYTSRAMVNELDPKGVIRESCDSIDNPNSTPIIVGLDVTGSMGMVLDVMARDGLSMLATEIYNRKPVSDPHIMMMGVGDVTCDSSPLQVTQFEADIRIAEQLTKIYLERGGGGNNSESYTLPWYFAAMNTKIDSFTKRGKKGYIFTMGDECPPKYLSAKEIEKILGDKPQFDKISSEELLTMVSREWEVYHLMVAEGSYYRGHSDKVVNEWTNLLGQRAIKLTDHKKMAETIVSILQISAGEDKDKVISSWDGTTSLVVKEAIKDLNGIYSTNSDVIKF